MMASDHMATLNARISVRLEINALLAALHSTGDDRLAAIHDALAIRTARRRINTSNAALQENAIEIGEGTAVYTAEIRLPLDSMTDIVAYFEQYMETQIKGQAMRMFGYLTGAMYGVLLDELDVDWKQDLQWNTDLGALLQNATGFTTLAQVGTPDLERYGYTEVVAFETAWVENYERLILEAQELLSGPTLRIDRGGDFIYEDGSLLVLYLPRNEVAYYGSFTFVGSFGYLVVSDGFIRLGPHYLIPAQDIAIHENHVIGPDWEIWLYDDYEIRENRIVGRITTP